MSEKRSAQTFQEEGRGPHATSYFTGGPTGRITDTESPIWNITRLKGSGINKK